MEYVKCNICEEVNTTLLYTKDFFNVVKCINCGLIYVNPRLDISILKKMYDKGHEEPDKFCFNPSFNRYLETQRDDYKTFKKRIRLIEYYKKTGRILDIGCSIGTFLNIARNRGWNTFGLDLNGPSIEYCKRELKLNVEKGQLEDMKLPSDFFDVIVMNDVIEHIPDSALLFNGINRILRNNGLLFITTPNIESPIAKLMKSNWVHLKPIEHIYYFTPSTIKKALLKAGFKPIRCQTLGRIRSLKTIIETLKSWNTFLYKIAKFLIKDNIGKYISFNLNLCDEIAIFAIKSKGFQPKLW